MRTAVSEGLFKGLAPEIQATGRHLLQLGQENLPLVSAGFNGMAKEALVAARTPFFTGGLQNIMGGTIDALGNMRMTVANVLTGFIGLGSIGSTYLPGIAGWIDKIAAGFANWVKNGIESGGSRISGACSPRSARRLPRCGQDCSPAWARRRRRCRC